MRRGRLALFTRRVSESRYLIQSDLTPAEVGGWVLRVPTARGDPVAVLLVVVGPAGRPDHDQQHCYHHAPTVKPEAATAVLELLMMGVRTPETC
jgi:hypothetical protein